MEPTEKEALPNRSSDASIAIRGIGGEAISTLTPKLLRLLVSISQNAFLPAIMLALLFLLTPTLFFTGTKDPFLIKEPVAKFFILAAALFAINTFLARIRHSHAHEGKLQSNLAKRSGNPEKAKEKSRWIPVFTGMTIQSIPSLWLPISLWLFSILFSLKNAAHKSLVFEFFFWQLLLGILYFLSCQIQEERPKKLIFNSIALASAIAGIYGALQHFGIDFVQWANSWGDRPSSSFGNPNFAAGWWVMTIPIFSAKFLVEKNKIRWLWLLLSLLMLANLYWGRTRGAWIAFALSSSIALIWLSSSKIKRLQEWIFPLAMGIFIGSVFVSFYFTRFFSVTDTSVLERKFKWATAWQMVKEYPLFGVGAGNLKVNFALYQAEVREKEPYKTHLSFRATSESNVHNEYFQIWAETGTFGLFSFLSIFFCYFFKFFKLIPYLFLPPLEKGEDERRGIWQLGIATSLFAFLFYSLTNFPLHIVPNACLLFFLLGIPEGELPAPKQQKQPEIRKNFILQILSFAILLLLTKKWILPPLQADYFRLQAEMAAGQRNFSKAIELYHRAIDLDFYRSERTAYDLGEAYRKIGKIEEALKSYQISVELRNYGEIYNNIGNCYYLLGKKEEAIQNWKTAIRLGLPDANAQKQTEKNIQLLKGK